MEQASRSSDGSGEQSRCNDRLLQLLRDGAQRIKAVEADKQVIQTWAVEALRSMRDRLSSLEQQNADLTARLRDATRENASLRAQLRAAEKGAAEAGKESPGADQRLKLAEDVLEWAHLLHTKTATGTEPFARAA